MSERSSSASSGDLYAALVMGAAAALFILLPGPLQMAGLQGAGVGAAFGLIAALVRRTRDPEKRWARHFAAVPVFAVGSAAGFVLVFWLASLVPRFLAYFN